ncbi:YetF domain-containing protein [Halobacillus sp. B23F22_1]|uniref:YetF domain-containing protein n=1 Tax=Halobacillus sp. B23F22_1 TaxID=3459514 RepID=UPI00373FB329
MDILPLSIKLVIGFLLLFFLIRVIGKKMIDQITPFHFISAIVLSELLGNAVYDESVPVISIVYTTLIWGGLLFIFEFIAQKSLLFRHFSEGQPTIVIRDGQIDFEQLKKARMNLNQLQSLLRQSEIFSIREVAFALVESNGSISVLKKAPYQKTTLEDFNMPPHPVYLPITLIKDGELLEENLAEINQNREWLNGQLRANGMRRVEDVLLAEWLENDGLMVIPHHAHQ